MNTTGPTGAEAGRDPGLPRPRRPGRLVRIALLVVAALTLIGLLVVASLGAAVRASLPRNEGEVALAGLTAPVRIERDGLGVPLLKGESRTDLARALGFLHAQERFFQMDLLRRQAAGEMAALIGAAALPPDRAVRVHGLRRVAETVVAAADPAESALLEAYTAGVNAGLEDLGARPFEYLLLRERPEPWRPADTVLVVLAMFLQLQDETGSYERMLGVVHETLHPELAAFLTPAGTEWDAPLLGGLLPAPPLPGPGSVDLRRAGARSEAARLAPGEGAGGGGLEAAASNAWAVAGAHTAHGGALLASDMHLRHGVPNVWYRAALVRPDPREPGAELRLAGLTLPGTPALVAGSNGHVAWGFTNSYVDTSDVILLETDPEDAGRYLTPDGPRPFERRHETLRARGGEEETLEVLSTVWGPVAGRDHAGRRFALRWAAHHAGAVDMSLLRMEEARDLDEALAVARRCGAPAQNLVAADASGRVGWTILGRVPRRRGCDGRLPHRGAEGACVWDGWLEPGEVPRLVDPPSGRLWSANHRGVGGEALARIGDGGYGLGARAAQIRDALFEIEGATERDLLGLQLDDRALFLARWRELFLASLSAAQRLDPAMRDLEGRVRDWSGRADVDGTGYRAVRAFRLFVRDRALQPLVAPCRAADPEFHPGRLRQAEGPLWTLVTERPLHLLDPQYETWDDLLSAAVEDVAREMPPGSASPSSWTWGRRNTVRVRHPFSAVLPQLSGWLDMPARSLPGDAHMPRVQSPWAGASERLVVSPGREEEGLLHMPCGQSGHPLSPHYRDQHEAWARGEPLPLLPGPAESVLVLLPADRR